MTDNDETLTGFSIGITAARRREEFGTALQRRGATVRYGPAIRIVPLLDDTQLLAATRRCLAVPLDLAVVTTGVGYRGWLEAATGWGLDEDLLKALSAATVLARGPKVRGAVRASGLREAWSPESESSLEVLDHLLSKGDLAGKRIAVQLHGEPVPGMLEALTAAGADVIEVPVYRWEPPTDPQPLHDLIRATVAREVQAVAFTSAPAATNFLRTADADGLGDQVRTALGEDVLAACVGSVTAAPLLREGIEVVAPERFRLGALVREIALRVPERFARTVSAGGRQLELRGLGVLLDGEYLPLAQAQTALLRLLSAAPAPVDRVELQAALPASLDAVLAGLPADLRRLVRVTDRSVQLPA